MNAIIPFSFETTQIRSITRGGEPWFAGADVCQALANGNSRQALSRLDIDEKDGVHITDSIGRPQKVTFINEPGVYRLIFTSRRPEAERFKRWLAHEVLPEIRRTGQFLGKEPRPRKPVTRITDSLTDQLRKVFGAQNRISDWSEYVPVAFLKTAYPDISLARFKASLRCLGFIPMILPYMSDMAVFIRYTDNDPEQCVPVRWKFDGTKWRPDIEARIEA